MPFDPALVLQTLLSRYFRKVTMRGLFAVDELHRIELIRCAEARKAARGPSVVGLIRKITPAPIKKFVRSRTANGCPPDMSYSTADLYYKNSGLESSLDLIAVCEK